MNLELFISILVISASATSIAIEIIKKLLDAANIKYKTMPLAVITSFIIGVIEMLIYTTSNTFSYLTIIYAFCMGVANVVGATTGYDTVKAFIYALFTKAK